ncbi:hypothetical protein [Actinocrinis sp.]|uniref:hypothetical protein n=1 Tax=Actinocrinis sp. TaxID=1920516 RepID=UPI002D746FD0|nr:hypothetical protein [Actinocrinis sp.]HZP49767.1 hypothetical protein [Actinocrinis sp.]
MNKNGEAGMDDERPADIGAGADVLEARYRRMLMLLPAAYREHRGEEMISTLLDGAPEGRRWPSVAELASLAALAMRLRVGAQGGTRRAIAVGEVLRRTALTGLLALGLWTGWNGVASLVVAWLNRSYEMRALPASTLASWIASDTLPPLDYLGAFVALLVGWRRLGRFLAVAQAGFIGFAVTRHDSFLVLSDRMAVFAVSLLIAVAAGSAFHREAPRMPVPRRWLISAAGLTGIILAVSGVYAALAFPPSAPDVQLAEEIAGVVGGPLVPVLAALFGLARARRSPIWPAALLTLGAPGLLIVPRAVIIYAQGKYENVFVGDLFSRSLWPGMPVYVLATEVVLAAALGWSLYRSRRRATAVPA